MPISITNALTNLNAMQPRFDRGYTGHEHMAGFGLINMNGRLFDPYLQRFLSPDNVVQSPLNAQNYNRYSYCMNNPLMYTDPTGWQMALASEYWNLGAENHEMRIGTHYPLGYNLSGGGGPGAGYGSGSYHYDYTNRCYRDNNNEIVSYGEVYWYMIRPNLEYNPAVSVVFAGTKNNQRQVFLGVNFSDGSFMQVNSLDVTYPIVINMNMQAMTNQLITSPLSTLLQMPEMAARTIAKCLNFDIDKVIATLNSMAAKDWAHADGHCGKHVIDSFRANGAKSTSFTLLAKDDGQFLLDEGYHRTNFTFDNYSPQIGDVVIFQNTGGHPSGHIQMWNGTEFVSSCFQGPCFWPNYDYRDNNANYTIYRLP